MKRFSSIQFLLLSLLYVYSIQAAGQSKGPGDKDAPWYSIKYECYGVGGGGDDHLYKGVDILQVPESEDAESVSVRIYLRLNDRHPKYHKHVLIDKFVNFSTGEREDWYALINPPKGYIWKSPEVVKIPKSWSFESTDVSYTATWNPAKQRYVLSSYENEEPYNSSFEQEMFGIVVECYRHDPEPIGQDKFRDAFDSLEESYIIRNYD